MLTTFDLGDAKVKEKQKIKKKFYCEVCDYTASQKIHYTKHLDTNKHKKKSEKVKVQIEADCKKVTQKWKQKWKCNFCSKQYESRNGLWKHKKTCVPVNMKIDSKPTPIIQNITNNITNNNYLNVNLFLDKRNSCVKFFRCFLLLS